MKQFTIAEIIHTPPWDLEAEFRVVATPECGAEDIGHFTKTITRCLVDRGALVAQQPGNGWTVKMPIDWERPKAPVLPPGLERVQVSITEFNKFRPWEVPALVHVVQRPEDSKAEIGMFVALTFPGTLKIHDAVIIESSGGAKSGNIKLLMWIMTTQEERDDMKAATELLGKMLDSKDPEIALALKAGVLADLNPQVAGRIMAKAAEEFSNLKSRN
jgi:hypothetical protein